MADSVLQKNFVCVIITRVLRRVRHSLDERNAKEHKTFSCFSSFGCDDFTQSLQNPALILSRQPQHHHQAEL